jgi:hypothetical protein
MQKIKYTGLGIASQTANVMAAGTVSNTLTATGSSSQANSYAVTDDVSVFTTAASNSGARLPSTSNAGDVFIIANYDANTMLIYPPTGGKINNGSANASINCTTLKTVMCISIDGTNFLAITSA